MPDTASYMKAYQVRYDECNLFGCLTPAAAVRYLQDIAVLHYNSANLTEGGNWIARRTIIDFLQPVPAYANLELRTFVGGASKVTSQRHYELKLEQGEPVLTGRTTWVYLGQNGRPARIPASFLAYFWPQGPLPLAEDPAWPAWPTHDPAVSRQKVRFSDLDILAHMNNTAYLDLLDNAGWEAQAAALPETGQLLPLHYDIEYLESARWGQELEVRTWLESFPNGEFERLQQVSAEGRPLARARSRWSVVSSQ
jgi:acyl-CoA thioesterase FadM